MREIFTKIGSIGILPVIVLDRAEDAEPLAKALIQGGLPAAEVTFRTAAAKDAIARIAKAYPEMLLGAGTVLTIDQAKAAREAGAQFIVTPGLNADVVEYCIKEDIPIAPGIATPSELGRAVEYGLDLVKFFPAEASGGINYLKSISAPFRSMSFIPTGGIDENNLASYLGFGRVLACGGSWMVKPEFLAHQQYDEITRRAAQAVNKMLNFSLRHIGINTPDAKEAEIVAGQINNIVGFSLNEGAGSIFVGTQFEVMKRMFLGAHGHIAIGTSSIDRAVAFLQRRGIGIKEDTKNIKDGKLQTVYLDLEIAGFAVHLVQV
jgi:2-dehydro-3-deoxyphosphogluconate aldolase/(4S)-4-hydroxy-2-oxoglutarate aldolase